MNVAIKSPQIKPQQAKAPKAEAPAPKSDTEALVDKIVDNTYLSANYAASGLSGTVSGAASWFTKGAPATIKIAGSAVKNVWKAETIGPTIKTLGVVAAAPLVVAGGIIALPVAAGMGLFQGAGEVDNDVPRQFTVGKATKEAYTEVGNDLAEFGNDVQESLAEFGNEKLEEGEKPFDIPLIKLGKTIIAGAIGAAVGGVAGLVSGAASMVSEGAKGVAKSLTADELNVAEKVFSAGTSVVSGAAHGVSYGIRTALGTFANSVGTTWDKDSLVEGGKGIFNDAKDGIAASVAPHTVLLEEKPAEQSQA